MYQNPNPNPQLSVPLVFSSIMRGLLIVLGALLCLVGQGCIWGFRVSPNEFQESEVSSLMTRQPELAWQAKLPSLPAVLLPLGPDVLLVATLRGELYSLNLKTGKQNGQMQQSLDKPITAHLVHREGPHIYIASAQEEELRAYDLARGKILWRTQVGAITGQLDLAGGLLLAASLTGEVSAYDINDGHLTWNKQLPGRIYQGVWIIDDRVLVLNNAGYLYALHVQSLSDTLRPEGEQTDKSGEGYPLLWEQQLPVNPNAVVGSGDGLLVIGDSEGRLLVIDPVGGETVFQTQLAAPIYSRPLITGDLVVAATAAGGIIALQRSDGSPVWQVQGEGLVRLPLMVMGGRIPQAVVVPFARGRLLALELSTGRELWRYDLEEGSLESASLTPNGIVVGDRRRHLFFLQPPDSSARQPE
ncbi:PQQ-binding-like beta-propeller repeat protein [Candidatus Neomarinimicrobiota bacterium]